MLTVSQFLCNFTDFVSECKVNKGRIMKIFSQRLKELRKDAGLSQIALAKELNLDKSTIAKYETAAISPSIEILVLFAKYFHVSTDYLLGLEE